MREERLLHRTCEQPSYPAQNHETMHRSPAQQCDNKLGELRARMETVIKKIDQKANERGPKAYAWEQYGTQCQQMCRFWIDRYCQCRDQGRVAYLQSLEKLITSYEGHMKIGTEKQEDKSKERISKNFGGNRSLPLTQS